ncbi:MAG: rhomboid family intramembrane serine protease [Bacteroidia bacterium]|nr:rhomboid family intramembrane serine protease [Bacteroidia bacterium]
MPEDSPRPNPFQTLYRITGPTLWLGSLMIVVFGVMQYLALEPGPWGIYPRSWQGLTGILTAPLVHGDRNHLISNLIPMIVLGGGLRYFYPKLHTPVWVYAWLATGLWVWAGARTSQHIGASGVVYALAFFLFFSGVFRRDVRSLSLALAVALFYGSMVWGVLPVEAGISWESHLFGAISGTFMAWFYRRTDITPRKTYAWEQEPDHSPDDDTAAWNYKARHQPPEGFSHPEDVV